MFCSKCGAQLDDEARFCSKCGAPVTAVDAVPVGNPAVSLTKPNHADEEAVSLDNPNHANEVEDSPAKPNHAVETAVLTDSVKKKVGLLKFLPIFIAAAVVVIIAIIAIVGLTALGSPKLRYNHQLSLGARYLEELDYEKAIAAYKAAIDIDPKNPEGYKALAELYMEMDDYEAALAILNVGINLTESDELQTLIKEAENGTGNDALEADLRADEAQLSDNGDRDDDMETESAFIGEKQDISVEVRQVDNSQFPQVSVYVYVTDENGDTIEDLKPADLEVTEISAGGDVSRASINDVYKMLGEENVNVNLVLDASGSMQGSRMTQAKNAAKSLLDYMSLDQGDRVSIFSFNDYVFMDQDFTSDRFSLVSAVDSINPNGGTALYDAIYSGVLQTYYESGAKCVIAFTDGEENASSYTFDDVVDIASNTSIPVYIIGVDDYGYDSATLSSLATQCSGRYYSANDSDIESILQDIYISIYKEQQDYYVIEYTSANTGETDVFRDLVIDASEGGRYIGHSERNYIPVSDINGAFSMVYMNKDYILDFTSQREVTDADLAGLSLAELRIARNEIFARHGRQFKDPLLNQWFYSKGWYLSLPYKYAPDYFDKNRPNPLSKLEAQNADYILAYEKEVMASRDIYPNAGSVLLSGYDLALSKPVLKTALAQMNNYPSTTVLEENKKLVQEAIDNPDVSY